jgi:diguanylate cyclase (GGDEF)-like protein
VTEPFVFKLLNPAIMVVLTTTFIILARRRPAYRYPKLLAVAFGFSGAAFAANDFLCEFDGPALRVAVNGLFTIAIMLACLSAYVRTSARIPTTLFVALLVGGASAFYWYLFVDTSTVARIYVVNATYASIALVTTVSLLISKPRTLIDWLFVGFTTLLLFLALGRPIALFLNELDTNAGGALENSVYWASIQALTPVLALSLALAFTSAFCVQAFNELRLQADIDFLTGLLNRRGFEVPATKLLSQGTAAAIMVADIDNFKRINDTFGHAIGDRVIRAVAHVLAQSARATLTARSGGEEFTLLFNDENRSHLLAEAGEIRTRLSALRIDGLPHDELVTLSIGIHVRENNEGLAEITARADEALYVAKAGGKDQAIITHPSLPAANAPLIASAHCFAV